MDIFAAFATDSTKEEDGVWIKIGAALNPQAPEAERIYPRLRIGRSGNKKHGRIVSKQYEANKSILDAKDETAEAVGERITVDAMAKAVLLGWENLEFRDPSWKPGEPYRKIKLVDGWNYNDAVMLLSLKDFRAMVQKHSDNFENFRLVAEEADAGN
jgi:hypothetical protein